MRILFTTTPGRGHFHPMVPLARALLERGHDVAWAAADHVCARLRGEGFDAMAASLAEDAAMAAFAERHPEVRDMPPAERPPYMFPRLFGPLRVTPTLDARGATPPRSASSPRTSTSRAASRRPRCCRIAPRSSRRGDRTPLRLATCRAPAAC